MSKITHILIWTNGLVYLSKQPEKENRGEKSTTPSTADLLLQDKCAKQALLLFNQAGYRGNEMAGYTNHYNQKLNKCFVEIQSTDAKMSPDTIWTYKTLSDAYEGKVYGVYSWHTEKDKEYWEVPPYICFIYPDGNQASLQVCKSEEEFNEFVKSFMEN